MLRFYFDEMCHRAVADGLKERGYEVIMAVDVGMTNRDDDMEHLPYATQRGLVLVTLDKPFAGRTQKHTGHTGLICWTGEKQDVGSMVRALIAFAEQHSPEQVAGRVFWLKG